jgi:hypothetical protein
MSSTSVPSRLVREAIALEAKASRLQDDVDHFRTVNLAEIAGAVDFLPQPEVSSTSQRAPAAMLLRPRRSRAPELARHRGPSPLSAAGRYGE